MSQPNLAGVVAAIAWCASLAAPLEAQRIDDLQDWEQQLVHQLEILDEQFARSGFTTTTVRTGLVDGGQDETVVLDLAPGTYVVAAVCDHDCSDVDLAVARDGVLLDRDSLEDDVPIVEVDVAAAGAFTFTVSMVTCGTPSCGYGLGVFRDTADAGGSTAELPDMEGLQEWQRQLIGQLQALDMQLAGDGLTPTHFESGLLAAGGQERRTLDFGPGSFFGAVVCDNDCTDVDLVLYDLAGNTLDEDLLADDAPIVDFFGPGRYQFEVRMVDCSTSTCGYALRVYKKD